LVQLLFDEQILSLLSDNICGGWMAELWKIIFFEDDDGEKPVVDYLLTLNKGERDRLQTRLEMLGQKGLSATKHLGTKLEDNLYELRLPNSPNNPRFLYCALIGGGRRLCVLHGFSKTGKANDKVPESQKQIALSRRLIVENREKEVKEELEMQSVPRGKTATKNKRGRK
jgi:phage-related protein